MEAQEADVNGNFGVDSDLHRWSRFCGGDSLARNSLDNHAGRQSDDSNLQTRPSNGRARGDKARINRVAQGNRRAQAKTLGRQTFSISRKENSFPDVFETRKYHD